MIKIFKFKRTEFKIQVIVERKNILFRKFDEEILATNKSQIDRILFPTVLFKRFVLAYRKFLIHLFCKFLHAKLKKLSISIQDITLRF